VRANGTATENTTCTRLCSNRKKLQEERKRVKQMCVPGESNVLLIRAVLRGVLGVTLRKIRTGRAIFRVFLVRVVCDDVRLLRSRLVQYVERERTRVSHAVTVPSGQRVNYGNRTKPSNYSPQNTQTSTLRSISSILFDYDALIVFLINDNVIIYTVKD